MEEKSNLDKRDTIARITTAICASIMACSLFTAVALDAAIWIIKSVVLCAGIGLSVFAFMLFKNW